MATIHDVANKAGVSVKTVSRVINNYEFVAETTRQKVQAVINDLNYAPSAIARQMRLGDSQSIGMLYGDPSSGYQAQLNHSMLKACSEANRYLAVELFNEQNSGWANQIELFLDRTRVRNMVLVPPMSDSVEIHQALTERGINFVLISPSNPIASASLVAMDDRLAAFEVTQHLINLGHKRIAHIAGHEDHVVTLLRRQGYEDALAGAGLDKNSQRYMKSGMFSFRRTLECTEELLSMDAPPTAIFAANDQMAVAVMMTAHRLGFRVPDDLSVTGFDDAVISRTIWPALTTVAQPFDEIARTAIRVLSGETSDKSSPAAHILPHEFIVRESTGPVPAN